jgi:L-seryl-tRNA(Ser) seleniumtransferase
LGIDGEPTVKESLKAGASLVAFSGDKLFGGPQAGIILGDANLVTQAKRNPLFRALRVDKLTIAALEATVSCYLAERASAEIPTQEAVHLEKKRIDQRARQFKRRCNRLLPDIQLTLADGFSVVGGGSAPQAELPTTLLQVEAGRMSAVEIETRLRECQPPVIVRIIDDQVVIDLRTVTREEESDLLRGILALSDK